MNQQAQQQQSVPKRKRKFRPPKSVLDCESAAVVVDFPDNNKNKRQLVTTTPASVVDKEIVLERFQKEIVRPFSFVLHNLLTALSSRTKQEKEDAQLKKQQQSNKRRRTTTLLPKEDQEKREFLRTRMIMGINQCSKLLEEAFLSAEQQEQKKESAPTLIILARDVFPPTMVAHIPVLASRLDIPLLLLPGKASVELGQALGTKKTSILVFLPSSQQDAEDLDPRHQAIDSFVKFVAAKVPTTKDKSTI